MTTPPRPAPTPRPQRGVAGRFTACRECGEEGRVSAFVLITFTALLLVAGLVLDGGNALAAKSRAIGIAEEAARTGSQQLDLAAVRAGRPPVLDPTGAAAAARAYLTAAGAEGTVTVTGQQVQVHATVTTHAQLLSLVGIGTFTVAGDGAAHATPTP